jgi:hypothetical protein
LDIIGCLSCHTGRVVCISADVGGAHTVFLLLSALPFAGGHVWACVSSIRLIGWCGGVGGVVGGVGGVGGVVVVVVLRGGGWDGGGGSGHHQWWWW